jgi:hypothetical protein
MQRQKFNQKTTRLARSPTIGPPAETKIPKSVTESPLQTCGAFFAASGSIFSLSN